MHKAVEQILRYLKRFDAQFDISVHAYVAVDWASILYEIISSQLLALQYFFMMILPLGHPKSRKSSQ